MNTQPKFSLSNLSGFAFGMLISLVMLFLLLGCANAPRWGNWSKVPTPEQIQAGRAPRDHYVYIPAYEIYYNSSQARYVFRGDQGWVSQVDPPRDISVEKLLASPSVVMTFNDAPARHHDKVARFYPRNWGQVAAVVASTRREHGP